MAGMLAARHERDRLVEMKIAGKARCMQRARPPVHRQQSKVGPSAATSSALPGEGNGVAGMEDHRAPARDAIAEEAVAARLVALQCFVRRADGADRQPGEGAGGLAGIDRDQPVVADADPMPGLDGRRGGYDEAQARMAQASGASVPGSMWSV